MVSAHKRWHRCPSLVAVLPLCVTLVIIAQERAATLQGDDQGALATEAASDSIFSPFASSVDADESPEGIQRLQEIEELASRLCRDRDGVVRERRPFAVRRDELQGEMAQAATRLQQNQLVGLSTARQLAQLESQIPWSTRSEMKQLQAQRSRLQSSLNGLVRGLTADRRLIDDRAVQVQALNAQVDVLDQRLVQLDEQLGECRQQWLRIRRPLERYSRGDFEGLRRVLDDWLVLDAQWPEALAWAALCAYELDEIDAAAGYLQRAQSLRGALTGSPQKWPQLEALTALLRQKQPGQIVKAEAALAGAMRLADKDTDWQTLFLAGRFYLERPADQPRAATCFRRALAIEPSSNCVRLWLARLQTVSTLPDVRDPAAATEHLEQLWEQDGHRSWRVAWFLADAYAAHQRSRDADALRRTAADLAPAKYARQILGGSP